MTNKSNNSDNKLKGIEKNIEEYKKQIDIKNQNLANIKKDNNNLEQKLKDMEAFMNKYFNKELNEAYRQQSKK